MVLPFPRAFQPCEWTSPGLTVSKMPSTVGEFEILILAMFFHGYRSRSSTVFFLGYGAIQDGPPKIAKLVYKPL
jgi:hypothetical protein